MATPLFLVFTTKDITLPPEAEILDGITCQYFASAFCLASAFASLREKVSGKEFLPEAFPVRVCIIVPVANDEHSER